ncbi:MAG: histidinol-phosphate transaminase [Clostridia bacterium]|nr:histidinol-phosphate transaminase [Clostridia bacterium]
MSRFLIEKHKALVPYTPGEQPKIQNLIKLNTNESPYPPTAETVAAAEQEAKRLHLYPDPTCSGLCEAFAKRCGVSSDQVIAVNGSDEILNFAFMAFCDESRPAVFPDITYGFYPVFAELNQVPYEEIPLERDLSVDPRKYMGIGKNIFLANPNAPTGIALSVKDIAQIVASNPDNLVVIDEAYVDFGAESCISLIRKYDNLLVTQTFSKSRSMAGARLGFGIGCEDLIRDLNTVRYSTNPYNVNRMTMAAGIATLKNDAITVKNCESIIKTRESTIEELNRIGFETTPSSANFIFARHPEIDGKDLYLKLKERGILVRHFDKERISQYNRITVGTPEQMQCLTDAIKQIMEESK